MKFAFFSHDFDEDEEINSMQGFHETILFHVGFGFEFDLNQAYSLLN